MRKLRVAREGIEAAHLFCPKPNFLINFLSRRAQTTSEERALKRRRAQTSENSVNTKFAEFYFHAFW